MESQDLYQLLAKVIHETRRRILLFALLLTVTSGIGYFLADDGMRYMFRMVHQVIFISPTEAFVTKIKVAISLGFIFSLPFFIYTIFGVLRVNTKVIGFRGQCLLTAAAVGLFILGGSFCYFAALPMGIEFLLGFATLEMQPMLSAGRLVSFVLMCVILFGVMFELPLIIMLLASLGLITADTLRAKRRYAVLGIFIVAGFLSPSPDVLSQVMMAVPLLFLYEIGIFLTRFCRQPEPEKLEMPADQQQIIM